MALYHSYSHSRSLKALILRKDNLLDRTTREHLATLDALSIVPANLLLSQ